MTSHLVSGTSGLAHRGARLRGLAYRVGHAVRTWVVRAPGTHVYLFALLVTTQTVHSLHPTLATELLRNTSTNLFQMGRNAGRGYARSIAMVFTELHGHI